MSARENDPEPKRRCRFGGELVVRGEVGSVHAEASPCRGLDARGRTAGTGTATGDEKMEVGRRIDGGCVVRGCCWRPESSTIPNATF